MCSFEQSPGQCSLVCVYAWTVLEVQARPLLVPADMVFPVVGAIAFQWYSCLTRPSIPMPHCNQHRRREAQASSYNLRHASEADSPHSREWFFWLSGCLGPFQGFQQLGPGCGTKMTASRCVAPWQDLFHAPFEFHLFLLCITYACSQTSVPIP